MDLVLAGGVKAGWYTPAPGSNAAARATAEKLYPAGSSSSSAAAAPPVARVDHVGFGVVQGEDK